MNKKKSLDHLHQKGIVEEELVCRMASKWEKVVDKATSLALGHKFINCDRSVKWWNEKLRQLVKDNRACFAQALGNKSNWNDYLRIWKELNQNITEERKNYTGDWTTFCNQTFDGIDIM